MAKILIVDDEQHNRLLLATVLGSAGHTVLEAKSGAEAIRISQMHDPELVIVDLTLPDMNGTELVKMLRADPDMSEVRLALYTASTISAATMDFMKAMRISISIPKPAEPEEILNAVDAALA
ncbi:MAG: response regulator [Candidatus Eremiobacteraeota bacterium]|nr:response regulator [Candidatus Eremiobacteraeota bacterium]